VEVFDLETLDIREGGYDRVELDAADITLYPSGEQVSAINAKDRYFIYQPPVIQPALASSPLLLSYIDVIAAGALSISESFAANFFQQNGGWDHILDDRKAPKYARVVPVSEQDQKYVDSYLAKLSQKQEDFSPAILKNVVANITHGMQKVLQLKSERNVQTKGLEHLLDRLVRQAGGSVIASMRVERQREPILPQSMDKAPHQKPSKIVEERHDVGGDIIKNITLRCVSSMTTQLETKKLAGVAAAVLNRLCKTAAEDVHKSFVSKEKKAEKKKEKSKKDKEDKKEKKGTKDKKDKKAAKDERERKRGKYHRRRIR
jgi:hypothetical protein